MHRLEYPVQILRGTSELQEDAMRKTLLFGLLFFLIGCDDMAVTNRTALDTRQETRSMSCSYAGLCRACELKSSGRTKCWIGYHQSCDGHRDARVNVQRYRVTYKSGRMDTQEETSVESFLTECR